MIRGCGSVEQQGASTLQAGPAGRAPFPGMVWVPGGTFLMGSDRHYPEERPAHCYRPAARFPEPVDTSTSHLGFRCIVRSASRQG